MNEAQLVKAHIIMGRKEHAARINEAWQKTVDGVIETGLRILDARHGSDALEHGQFQKMLTEDLHFDASMGRRLMSIASNKVLSNRAHVHALPAKWGTLYELTVIENRGYDLEAGIASGAIHPKMERKDVKALLPPPQRYDDLEEAEEDDDEVRAETSAEERKASYAASEDDDDFDEETHRLVCRAIEFTSGYIKGFKAWRKTADVSDEGSGFWRTRCTSAATS